MFETFCPQPANLISLINILECNLVTLYIAVDILSWPFKCFIRLLQSSAVNINVIVSKFSVKVVAGKCVYFQLTG